MDNKRALIDATEYTCVKSTDTLQNAERICRETLKYGFAAVVVNPVFLQRVVEMVKGKTEVCTTVAFPFGSTTVGAKMKELEECIRLGADAVDMVINVSAMKSQMFDVVEEEIRAFAENGRDVITKIILETCYLDKKEIILACEMAAGHGIDYVKTTTGMGSRGASLEDVSIMKAAVNKKCKIKAAGGIKTVRAAFEFLDAGVTRLGLSSAVDLIKQL
jgi:deoxyribose-phosphate aldolase